MKNKDLVHYHESARIYRNYYKPSFNVAPLAEVSAGCIYFRRQPGSLRQFPQTLIISLLTPTIMKRGSLS
jgi:hypothetical protein